MTEVLLCYIIGFFLCAAGLTGLFFLLKKRMDIKVRWGTFFIGFISAVVYFLIIMLLFRATFRSDYYYNTTLFRTLVGFVFLALLAVARLLLVKAVFFTRYKEEQGFSFSFGFGAAPLAFLGLYLLIMSLVVAGNGIFNGPCIVENEGYLSFADNTIISVFRPAAGHVSFAVLFVALAAMFLLSSALLRRISEKRYHPAVSVSWVIFMVVLEAIAILPIPFIAMYGLSHWQLALIACAAAAISALLLIVMPKEQKPANYIKQFE